MKEIFGTKTKISMNSSEEINFQTYVESAKQRKTPWNIFENFMKDLTYSSLHSLNQLSEILLIELTIDYSDIDRLKYLNSLLLREFKEFIEREDLVNTTENDHCEESSNSAAIFDEINEIIRVESETQIIQSLQDEGKEHFVKPTRMNKTNIKSNKTKFSCQFCNKQYYINFHLKQHIRNVHDKIKKIENEEAKVDCDFNDVIAIKVVASNCEYYLDAPLNKDRRCHSGDKAIFQSGDLKKHIPIDYSRSQRLQL